MFYVGQTVYSESLGIPAIYLGREWKSKGKEYELSHHILCDEENVDDWEFCDLAVLVNRSGAVYRGDHSTDRFTGLKIIEAGDFEDMVDSISKTMDMIKEKKLKVLSLTFE